VPTRAANCEKALHPRSLPVEHYVADVIIRPLEFGNQAGGLKADGIQLADGNPPESVAGLGATIQIVVREPGRPGEAVVEANLVLEGAVPVDVLHGEGQSPSREPVPKLFG